jgi:hypothetical protein
MIPPAFEARQTGTRAPCAGERWHFQTKLFDALAFASLHSVAETRSKTRNRKV